jgi:hypothetical protein
MPMVVATHIGKACRRLNTNSIYCLIFQMKSDDDYDDDDDSFKVLN